MTQQTFASWPDDDDYKNWLAKNPILFVDVVGLDQILSDISELSLFHNPDWPKVFAYLTDEDNGLMRPGIIDGKQKVFDALASLKLKRCSAIKVQKFQSRRNGWLRESESLFLKFADASPALFRVRCSLRKDDTDKPT